MLARWAIYQGAGTCWWTRRPFTPSWSAIHHGGSGGWTAARLPLSPAAARAAAPRRLLHVTEASLARRRRPRPRYPGHRALPPASRLLPTLDRNPRRPPFHLSSAFRLMWESRTKAQSSSKIRCLVRFFHIFSEVTPLICMPSVCRMVFERQKIQEKLTLSSHKQDDRFCRLTSCDWIELFQVSYVVSILCWSRQLKPFWWYHAVWGNTNQKKSQRLWQIKTWFREWMLFVAGENQLLIALSHKDTI